MPVIPENYLDGQAVAVAGAINNMEPNVLISRTVETEDGVGFGVAVIQGAEDRGCDVGAGDVVGITVLDRSAEADGFAQHTSARIMTKGTVWVKAGSAVSAGDPVFATPAGVLLATESTNAPIANARFDTSAASGELAVVRLA